MLAPRNRKKISTWNEKIKAIERLQAEVEQMIAGIKFGKHFQARHGVTKRYQMQHRFI